MKRSKLKTLLLGALVAMTCMTSAMPAFAEGQAADTTAAQDNGTAKSEPQDNATIASEGVNLRSKAEIDASVVTTLAKGESIRVIRQTEDWYYVHAKGQYGYMKMDYVKLNDTQQSFNTLQIGNNGDEVKRLQEALIEIGYLNGLADGKFSGSTEDALKQFQLDNKIVASGVADYNTQALLYGQPLVSTGIFDGIESSISLLDLKGNITNLQDTIDSISAYSAPVVDQFGSNTVVAAQCYQRTVQVVEAEKAAAAKAEAERKVLENNKKIQTQLKKWGFYTGSIDGDMGTGTQNAVKAFQKANGLKADGILGAATEKKLFASSAVTKKQYDAKVAAAKKKSSSKKSTVKASNEKTQPAKSNGKVEMTPWSTAKNIWKRGQYVTVIDVRTGITMKMKRMGGTYHADVEPATKSDTSKLLQCYGGKWSWNRRPVWVVVNGKYMAGSINGMPHGQQTITNNGMNGQVCIHFLGSKTHGGGSVCPQHQACIKEAFNKG